MGSAFRALPALLGVVLLVPGRSAGEDVSSRLVRSALAQTTQAVRYDPAYFVIGYPGGDVPADRGVCTDVVIRAYRSVGLDLQRLVHEDMKAHFSAYPKLWGLSRTDRNIDHRRVPNLQTFFRRRGAALPVTDRAEDYLPGDLVAWDLTGNGLWHIGIVVPPPGSADGKAGSPWIVHNIGAGPRHEERLFEWKIIGHYRYGEGVPANHPIPSP
jgi:uncharacterized protein YijF (DUF1287 family)